MSRHFLNIQLQLDAFTLDWLCDRAGIRQVAILSRLFQARAVLGAFCREGRGIVWYLHWQCEWATFIHGVRNCRCTGWVRCWAVRWLAGCTTSYLPPTRRSPRPTLSSRDATTTTHSSVRQISRRRQWNQLWDWTIWNDSTRATADVLVSRRPSVA